jgi:carboxymethylenebutenolidase
MYESKHPIDELVHLYVDGAFDRRELVQRVVRVTGSLTAAVAALAGFEELRAQPPSACPADVRVPADAADLEARDVEFAGPGGRMLGYLVKPKTLTTAQPAVIVIHENRGLVEHIRDVTRRAARAGFVALGVDLLSRQGGTSQFTEPTQQTAAYNRTTPYERRSDLIAALDYLKGLDGQVIHDRVGLVGFCAGGGNVWDLIVNIEEIAAAVPFYGAPPTDAELLRIKTPVLGMYAERDRALTARIAPVMTSLLAQQKVFGLNVYEGVGHAFHNDTGAAYNAEAACDAWQKTISFFNKFLRAPRT